MGSLEDKSVIFWSNRQTNMASLDERANFKGPLGEEWAEKGSL